METYWFAFYNSQLIIEKLCDGTYTVPHGDRCPINNHDCYVHNIDTDSKHRVKTFNASAPPADTANYELCPLRESYYKLPLELYLEAGKCEEILYWDSTTRYCGRCGATMSMNTAISKICDNCHCETWPQLATAVICLMHRDDEILLVRAHNFRGNFYGLVAGFVETGETLEHAVQREIAEETGLTVKNIKYFGSQPWPYPNGLMIGFCAEYAGGKIHIQKEELREAGWFHIDTLPEIPAKLSIARLLIDNHLKMKGRL